MLSYIVIVLYSLALLIFSILLHQLYEYCKSAWRLISDALNKKYILLILFLKTRDTICYCQKPVFSIGVSQHMHKITNLWKFELNRSSKLRDNIERKNKTICHTKLCAFRCSSSRPPILNPRARNQISQKITFFSRKLRHFRESRFSQCFILSTYPQYSTSWKVLC